MLDQKKKNLLKKYHTWSPSKKLKQDRLIRLKYGPSFLRKLQKTCVPHNVPPSEAHQRGSSQTISSKSGSVAAVQGEVYQVEEIPISDNEVTAPTSNLPDEIFSPNVGDSSLVIDEDNIPAPLEIKEGEINTDIQQDKDTPRKNTPLQDVRHGRNSEETCEPKHMDTPFVTVHRRKAVPKKSLKFVQSKDRHAVGEREEQIGSSGSVMAQDGSSQWESGLAKTETNQKPDEIWKTSEETGGKKDTAPSREDSSLGIESPDQRDFSTQELDGGDESRNEGSNNLTPKEAFQEQNIMLVEEDNNKGASPIGESTRNIEERTLVHSLDEPGQIVGDVLIMKVNEIPKRKTARKRCGLLSGRLSTSLVNYQSLPGEMLPPRRSSSEKRRLNQEVLGHSSKMAKTVDCGSDETLLKEKVLNKQSPVLKVVCAQLKSPEVLKGQFNKGSHIVGDTGGGKGGPLEEAGHQSLNESAKKVADTMKEKIKQSLSNKNNSAHLESPEIAREDASLASFISIEPNNQSPFLGGVQAKALEHCGDQSSGSEPCHFIDQSPETTGPQRIDSREVSHLHLDGSTKKFTGDPTSALKDVNLKSPSFKDVLAELKSAKLLEQIRKGEKLSLDGNSIDSALKATRSRSEKENTSGSAFKVGETTKNINELLPAGENPEQQVQEEMGIKSGTEVIDTYQDTLMQKNNVKQNSVMLAVCESVEEMQGGGKQGSDSLLDKSEKNTNGDKISDDLCGAKKPQISEVQNGEDNVKMAVILEEDKVKEMDQDLAKKVTTLTGEKLDQQSLGIKKVTWAQNDHTLQKGSTETTKKIQGKRMERRRSLWEGSLRIAPAKFIPFQVPMSSSPKRKAVKEEMNVIMEWTFHWLRNNGLNGDFTF